MENLFSRGTSIFQALLESLVSNISIRKPRESYQPYKVYMEM